MPVQFRYVKDIYNGDKRMELNVVPAFSVRVTPPLAVMPAPAAGAAAPVEREIHVAVTNGTKGAAEGQRRAEAAGRLEADAGERADRVRARGRVAVGALPGDRAARRRRPGEYTVARRRDVDGDGAREVRERLPGDRVSARAAPAGDQAGGDGAEGRST